MIIRKIFNLFRFPVELHNLNYGDWFWYDGNIYPFREHQVIRSLWVFKATEEEVLIEKAKRV